ncbi:MAG: glycosyltransferase [Sphingobacteriaceae bacterium]|nr:MAG: glycosyltransferase [Sphingobacteriaceae bacterium]
MISIIIPSFQSAAYIGSLLESIGRQTYTDYEVLIMDGGSSDKTAEIVASFFSLPVTFHHAPDQGVYDAMNKGIKKAQGQWLYFIGCDDKLYTDNTLSDIAELLAGNHFDIVYGDVLLTSNRSRYAGEFDLDRLLFEKNICHQAIFYRKTVFDKVGFYNLRYKIWGDWELNIRCFRHTELVIKHVNTIIAYYNDESGVSSKYDTIFCEELPSFHIHKEKSLEAQNNILLTSKSYLIGKKITGFINAIGIGKLLKK